MRQLFSLLQLRFLAYYQVTLHVIQVINHNLSIKKRASWMTFFSD